MTEELTLALEAGHIDSKTASALANLQPGNFCQHKSWGFGQVSEWKLASGQIFIDFISKKNHPMQPAYAASSLTPIPADHIFARRHSEPQAVEAESKQDPVGLTKKILSDLGGRATADQIAACLVPGVLDATGFKRWWDATKKKLKADGHFQIPSKKNEPFVLLATSVNHANGLIESFFNARYTKEQLIALDQISKALGDLAESQDDLQRLVLQIDETAQKNRRLHAAAAVDMLLTRDEILRKNPKLATAPDTLSVAEVLVAEENRLSELLNELPASRHRKVLEEFPGAFGNRWTDRALRLLRDASSRQVVEICRLFREQDSLPAFQAALSRSISDRSITTEVLIWLCKERGASFENIFNANLLAAVFSALEMDMLNEKRTSRLQDLLFADRQLLGDMLKGAPLDTVRDIMRKLLLTPVFDDLSKRSLLARIVKDFPETQSMISGDAQEKQLESSKPESTLVSWASLEKRKADYENLIHREIPQNLKDINIAKEQGDLRENFGFKAAKEQQRVLERRKVELEKDLANARGVDFDNPDTRQVSIGTVVTLTFEDGNSETFSILGAWDSAPELGIISYKAALGQALLGRKTGEQMQLPGEKADRLATIASIKPFTDHDILVDKVHVIREFPSQPETALVHEN